MLSSRHSHVLIDIKLFLSVNVFTYTPLGISGPKNKMFPKPEVTHKKVKSSDHAVILSYIIKPRMHTDIQRDTFPHIQLITF